MRFSFAAIFVFFTITSFASEDLHSNTFRLDALNTFLEQFKTVKNESSISTGFVTFQQRQYALKWNKHFKSDNSDRISFINADEIARKYLKAVFPKEYAPTQKDLLSIGKYIVGDSYLWVVEYTIKDESAQGGYGPPITLFVPVSTSGTVLMTITPI